MKKEGPASHPDVDVAAMRYIMMMLLQRLDAAGHVQLKEMIAGVESDQQASGNTPPVVQETFNETLRILRLANNGGR